MSDLSEHLAHRHEVEREFHDAWARTASLEEANVLETFQGVAATENRYILQRLGDLAGRDILDLGCGLGDATTYFALQGARVTAVDISPGMVEFTRRLTERYGVVHRVQAREMAAEVLEFPEESFDIVYGNGILHHVELETAAQEIARVLRQDGTATFIEPLAYNPVIQVYRTLASGVRTSTERPLHFRDLEVFVRHFAIVEHREFQLFTLLVFLWFFFGERLNPSYVRYWKRIQNSSQRYDGVFRRLEAIDQVLLGRLPSLRRYCWNTVITLAKEPTALKRATDR